MWKLLCLILAIALFLLSAFGMSSGKVNLQSLGLAFFAAYFLPIS